MATVLGQLLSNLTIAVGTPLTQRIILIREGSFKQLIDKTNLLELRKGRTLMVTVHELAGSSSLMRSAHLRASSPAGSVAAPRTRHLGDLSDITSACVGKPGSFRRTVP